jgi:hypothetical protein
MKKALAVVLLLLAIETWGVIGATVTMRLVYSCTIKVGPLCYAWEESMFAKALGMERAQAIEGEVRAAKEKWDQQFLDTMTKGREVKDAFDLLQGIIKRAITDH